MRRLVFFLILSSEYFITLSEVVGNNFKECKKYFLDKTPPDFTPPASVSVKPICQCLWDDNDDQIYLYATLYSTTWKIPVYSAYVFGSPNIGRCDVWYIEPQLDGDQEPCMRPKGRGKNIGTNQAVQKDYHKSVYDKGHLYPVLHTNNHLSMLATSSLTNAAPQDSTFNRNVWLQHERAVIKDLETCEEAYVVTGVVPETDTTKFPPLGKGVYVSKYYWRATCCLKNKQYLGKGYYGPDNNGNVKELSIKGLHAELNKEYTIKIFPSIPYQPKKPTNTCE